MRYNKNTERNFKLRENGRNFVPRKLKLVEKEARFRYNQSNSKEGRRWPCLLESGCRRCAAPAA